mmetsp:Transcript_99747/g.157886  ORF Transcript_99747/g.157886 Transcript_99747/m.157886 type:complete len:354 (+) Transcript_99747:57-1118(+)
MHDGCVLEGCADEDSNDPAWSGIKITDVARIANSGSYQKALGLVQDHAVKILINCADGSVEASVRSEHSNSVYEVRVERKEFGCVVAACNCYDFKRRGGLCKHGAAALIHLICTSDSSVPANLNFKASLLPGSRKSKVASCSEVARPLRSQQINPPAKKPRLENDVAHGLRSESAPSDAGISPPTLAVPQFPRSVASRGVDLNVASDHKSRSHAIRSAMSMRLLRNHAAKGEETAFSSELARVARIDDVKSLLLTAATGDNKAGALRITERILERPEGKDMLDEALSANGRALLHIAVASERLDLCRMLLERRANVQVRDGTSSTPLDLARCRKLDASGGKLEDPFVALLSTS